MKRLRQLNAALEHFILLLEGKIGAELIAFGTKLRSRSAGPVHLEERTGDIGDTQAVSFKNAAGFFDFLRVQLEEVFVPHTAQLDPVHAEIVRGNFARAAEILSDFVVDDSYAERRLHTLNPSLSSTYFLLMSADSFGVRALSGTLSNSTMAHPRKFTR